MSKKIRLKNRFSVISIFIVLTFGTAAGLGQSDAGDSLYGAEVIVCFKDVETTAQRTIIASMDDAVIIDRNDALNCVLVKTMDADAFITHMSKSASVEYAEPNGVIRALYIPNDPFYDSQWGPQQIDADRAWDIEKGDKNITIAIVDTGVDYNHEDLLSNYIVGGYDWVNDDTDPMDDNGHGTHCAGIVAATMDNGRGIAGIAQVNIIAEKVLNSTGWGEDWDLAQAITHAADSNVDIISMSLGGDDAQIVEDACQYAWDNGCLLVAASGNEYAPLISHPAAYDTVIAVGATDPSDQHCAFSNWGPELELVSPGINILSSYPSNQYISASGTSTAAPHVAGAAALVWSMHQNFTNQDVRDRLDQTAKDLGLPGRDEYYGYGRVDTLQAINQPPTVSVLSPNGGEVLNGTITLAATADDSDGSIDNLEFQYSQDGGGNWTSIKNVTIGIFKTYTCQWDTTTVPNGVEYLIRAIATDNNGATASDTSDRTFTIDNVAGLCGDVNGDEYVDIVDAMFIAQYTVGNRPASELNMENADVNCANGVNIVDAMFIAQYIVGEKATLDCC